MTGTRMSKRDIQDEGNYVFTNWGFYFMEDYLPIHPTQVTNASLPAFFLPSSIYSPINHLLMSI